MTYNELSLLKAFSSVASVQLLLFILNNKLSITVTRLSAWMKENSTEEEILLPRLAIAKDLEQVAAISPFAFRTLYTP